MEVWYSKTLEDLISRRLNVLEWLVRIEELGLVGFVNRSNICNWLCNFNNIIVEELEFLLQKVDVPCSKDGWGNHYKRCFLLLSL